MTTKPLLESFNSHDYYYNDIWICSKITEVSEKIDISYLSENSLKELLFHSTHLQIAQLIGQMSYCVRKKVGAVLVKKGQIISTGYNGALPNLPNRCEDSNNITLEEIVHAEINCLAKIAKNGWTGCENATLYVTLSPCIDCFKASVAAGVTQLHFNTLHSSFYKLKILKLLNVDCWIWSKDAHVILTNL